MNSSAETKDLSGPRGEVEDSADLRGDIGRAMLHPLHLCFEALELCVELALLGDVRVGVGAVRGYDPFEHALDHRILEHPRAYHLRRMRAGIWLYLDLLARLPAGTDTFEVEPAAVGRDMGLPEGTVRSWLGHLRKAGYLDAIRLNGTTRVTVKRAAAPEPPTSGSREGI